MGNIQNVPFEHADKGTRVELSMEQCRHCKKMVSYFVSKSIYYNSWFVQFFYWKISIKKFHHRLVLSTGIVRTRHFAKTLYQFERNLDTMCWLIRVFCKKKKQVFEATENKSRWLFLQTNLVLKNNVESVRSNLYEL